VGSAVVLTHTLYFMPAQLYELTYEELGRLSEAALLEDRHARREACMVIWREVAARVNCDVNFIAQSSRGVKFFQAESLPASNRN
jgi:hypothetical protein